MSGALHGESAPSCLFLHLGPKYTNPCKELNEALLVSMHAWPRSLPCPQPYCLRQSQC